MTFESIGYSKRAAHSAGCTWPRLEAAADSVVLTGKPSGLHRSKCVVWKLRPYPEGDCFVVPLGVARFARGWAHIGRSGVLLSYSFWMSLDVSPPGEIARNSFPPALDSLATFSPGGCEKQVADLSSCEESDAYPAAEQSASQARGVRRRSFLDRYSDANLATSCQRNRFRLK